MPKKVFFFFIVKLNQSKVFFEDKSPQFSKEWNLLLAKVLVYDTQSVCAIVCMGWALTINDIKEEYFKKFTI